MKILKYILYVIIGLIVLFIAVGFIKPSVSYGAEITVDQPAKITWAVSSDESKFDQWLEGFKSIELISGEENEVGSQYKVIVNPGEGQPDFEMIETIKSIKEFDHIEFVFDSDMMVFDQKVTHTEKDGKTTVKSQSKVTGKGVMTKSMFALMSIFGNAFQKQEQKNFDALKKLIEENTTDYYPEPEPVEEEGMDGENGESMDEESSEE